MLLNACKKAVGDSSNTIVGVYIVMKLFPSDYTVWKGEESCLGWIMIEEWTEIF